MENILLELVKNHGLVIVVCLLLLGLAFGPLGAFIFLVLQFRGVFEEFSKELIGSIKSVTEEVHELKQAIDKLPKELPVSGGNNVHRWRQ